MGAKKRKRGDDGVINAKRQKPEEDNNVVNTAVTEEEVEEFFTILRRLKAAAKCYRRENGVECQLTDQRWKPSFVREDFDHVKAVNDEIKKEDNIRTGLDLNSEPTS